MESRIKVYELLEGGGSQLIGYIPAFHRVFYEKVQMGTPDVRLEFGPAKLKWHFDKVSAVYIEPKHAGQVGKVPGFELVTTDS